MSRKPFVLAVSALVLVVAVTVPAAGARDRSARAAVVTVTMKEYKFGLSVKSAKAGKITFTLVNKGKLAHDIRLAGRTSALVQPGKTGKLVVTLKKGKYPYKCTLPGHAALGMKGTFTVT